MNNTQENEATEDREAKGYADRARECGSAFILAILIHLAERDGIRIDPVTRQATRIG